MSMSSSSGLMGTELISAPKIHQPHNNNNMSSASQMVMGGKMRSGSRAISATHFRREFLLGLRAAAATTAQHPETALRCRHGRRRRRRRRLDYVIAMVRDQSEDGSIPSEKSSPSTTTNGVGVSEIKEALHQSLQGINRGIFGVTSSTKSEIERLVMQLESLNPNPNPTSDLQKVGGSWRLLFTTITILGSKRTKLGLRDFISLDDFFQVIDIDEGKAANVIRFSVRGLNLFNGQLTIEASYTIASPKRVDLKGQKSNIVPDQLMNIFKKNYDLLLSIFNPEGWHEITYLDEDMRIGRDDKGNLFVLEKSDEETDFRSNELFKGLQGSNLL